jgi:uncharacterized protein
VEGLYHPLGRAPERGMIAPRRAARDPRSPVTFTPYPGLSGGHRQTIVGHWLRSGLGWPHPAEDRTVEAGDDVRLLVRASWQPGPRAARPALVLVHGLGGTDRSSYVLATGQHAHRRGWHVLRMNMRGAGDGEAVCARLYNGGLDADVLAVLRHAAAECPRIALAGFSLGANLVLLALGRSRALLPEALEATVVVSPPADLAACATQLEWRGNLVYQRAFMEALCSGYRARQQRRPDLYELGRERGARTVREYDDRITAPYAGFASAAEYYERSSAGPWLAAVDRPTLMLVAEDDPMIPAASVLRWPVSPQVRREVLPTGGHAGFVGWTSAPGSFWAAERAMDWLEEIMTPGVGRAPRSAGHA